MSQQEEWGIASSVGMTALVAAAGRSIESHSPDALIDDPYAEAFVAAAEIPVPIPTRPGSGIEPVVMWEWLARYIGMRTRYFDDFLLASCGSGVRQAVILAAGLDTRAFRLDWPAGTRVFELDGPEVLKFKAAVLRDQGAAPGGDRRTVPVDLSEEWAEPLRRAGFDPALPTAWIAEGLLPYLPGAAQRELVATVASLSAPGSRAAIEYFLDAGGLADDADLNKLSQQFGFDMSALIPSSSRATNESPGDWLPARWTSGSEPVATLATRYGRDSAGFPATGGPNYLTAHAG